MMNKRNNKGFTLAELLIVVAIIAVLVAIAIPVFTTQLEKSRESTDASNIRGYYAEIATALLTGDLTDAATTTTTTQVGAGLTATVAGLNTAKAENDTYTVTVDGYTPVQKTAEWQSGDQTVAGATIAANADIVGKTKIKYTFTLGADKDAYLSSITFE